jgi:hypothetical protein
MRPEGFVLGPCTFLRGLAFIRCAVALEMVAQGVQLGKRFHYRSRFIYAPTLGFEVVLKKAQRFPLLVNEPARSLG